MDTFRVFISSTFKNFQFERNYLSQNLYKPLDNLCRSRGYAFHDIDLRWGISNEASIDNKSLLLCLEEIKKCQATNIKPNFLLMLGDYYGWKPLPYLIPLDEYNLLYDYLDEESRGLFKQCYALDENYINKAYVLQARCGDMLDDAVWKSVEGRLHSALEKAAVCALPSQCTGKYIYSATHQEVNQGLFIDDDIKAYTFVFIKDEGNIYKDDEDYDRAQQLKKRIMALLPASQYAVYSSYEQFPEAVSKAYNFLQETISSQINISSASSIEDTYFNELDKYYIPNFDFEQELLLGIKNCQAGNIFVTSLPHGGKTTLFRRLNKMIQNSYFWSANTDFDHQSILQLVRYIIKVITRNKENPILEYDNACYFLQKALDMGGGCEEKVVFLIDGADSLLDYKEIGEMIFHVRSSQNIVFLFSVEGFPLGVDNLKKFSIPPMSYSNKSKFFLSILQERGRCLSGEQHKYFMSLLQTSDLQFIRFIANKAVSMRSYDPIQVAFKDLEGLVHEEINSLSSPAFYGNILIERILNYLVFSEFGISEFELLELLRLDKEVLHYLKQTVKWEFDESLGIPKVILYRIMSDLSYCIIEYIEKGEVIYRLSSSTIMTTIRKYYNTQLRAEIYELYKSYFKSKCIYRNKKGDINDRVVKQLISIARKESSELCKLLDEVSFCDGCIKLNEIGFLLDGYAKLNKISSTIYKTIINNISQLQIFKDMFISYYHSENKCSANKVNYFDNHDIIHAKYVINFLGEDIKYAYFISDDEYVVAYGNMLVILNSTDGSKKAKRGLPIAIKGCCLSADKTTLLIAGIQISLDNCALFLYLVNAKNLEINKVLELKNPASKDSFIGEQVNIQPISNSDFFVMFSVGDLAWFKSEYYAYSIIKSEIKKLFSFKALTFPSVGIIGDLYCVMHFGAYVYVLYSLVNGQLLSRHAMPLCPNGTIISSDEDTTSIYSFSDEKGLYKISVNNNKLVFRKVFILHNEASAWSNKFFLNNCFLQKFSNCNFSNVYTFDGKFLGTVNWDGNSYVLEKRGKDILVVTLGGGIIRYTIDEDISYDLTKINYSLSQIYKNIFRGLKRAKSYWKRFNQSWEIKVLSPDGEYLAKLSQNSLTIFHNGKICFKYYYNNKKCLDCDVKFISKRVLVWRMSPRQVKIIDIQKKKIEAISKLNSTDELLVYGQEMSIRKGSLDGGIWKYIIGDTIQLKKYYNTDIHKPEKIIKSLRKQNKIQLLFCFIIPSQLIYDSSENDLVIYLDSSIAVRMKNNILYCYTHNSEEVLMQSYVESSNYIYFERGESHINTSFRDNVKIHNNILYIYLYRLHLIIVYDYAKKSRLQYWVDQDVSDVEFDNNIIRIFYNNDTIKTIDVVIA